MRFKRQMAYVNVGEAGQAKLASARVAICGVGALGSMVAERLFRCGIGYVRLIDRDWVELDNLPRQTLFTLADAQGNIPKAIAAEQHLREIDPESQLDVHVADVTHRNAAELLGDVDCIIDGSDNFETRYLINDVAVKHSKPWIHGGVVGATGQLMAIVPGRTACFRCLMPEPPSVEHMQTCDSAGVLGPAVGVIANWQAMEALRVLLSVEQVRGELRVLDLWRGDVRSVNVSRVESCVCCGKLDFEFLNGRIGTDTKVMCGKNSVQIQSLDSRRVQLDQLANRLSGHGRVTQTAYFLRFAVDAYVISVFADGRGIVFGTENPDEARKIYARWIGG